MTEKIIWTVSKQNTQLEESKNGMFDKMGVDGS